MTQTMKMDGHAERTTTLMVNGKLVRTGIAGVDMDRIERAASVAYAAIRQLGETCGEWNRPTWQIAPSGIKSGYRIAVRKAMEWGSTPAEVHEAWCADRDRQGWSFGADYDEARRTHPMLRPWAELTEVQRFQYRVLTGVARAFEE